MLWITGSYYGEVEVSFRKCSYAYYLYFPALLLVLEAYPISVCLQVLRVCKRSSLNTSKGLILGIYKHRSKLEIQK
jgi:hypothetical protein